MSNLVVLEDGEEILAEVRRHKIVFYTRIIFIVIFFFVPLFLTPLAVNFINFAGRTNDGGIFWGFLISIWLLILWMAFFYQWTDYHLDVWVVTNKRIIDIEQKGPLHQIVSVFRLEQIEDITASVNGLMAIIFKYGDVHIHTAGHNEDITIRQAARPYDVKNLIIEAQGKAMGASHHHPII